MIQLQPARLTDAHAIDSALPPLQYHTRMLLQCLSSFSLSMLPGEDCRAWCGERTVNQHRALGVSRCLRNLIKLCEDVGVIYPHNLVSPRSVLDMRVVDIDDWFKATTRLLYPELYPSKGKNGQRSKLVKNKEKRSSRKKRRG